MSRPRAVATSVVVALSVGAVALVASPSTAATEICDQYGSTTIQGRYIVQNNRWGADTTQCISVSDTGFSVSRADHNKATNGAPASYPSAVYGWHYNNGSPGTILPAAATSTAVRNLTTSASLSYPSGGTWNASYDLWYDPTARKDGQNLGMEIMVWMNYQGSIQPIGSKVGTATVAGRSWDLWQGTGSGDSGSWTVVSYVRQGSPITSISFKPDDFFRDTVNRGYAQTSWYMTSIQAGFEPWVGGTGLALNNFSVGTGSVETTTPTPTTPVTTTPTPTTTTPVMTISPVTTTPAVTTTKPVTPTPTTTKPVTTTPVVTITQVVTVTPTPTQTTKPVTPTPTTTTPVMTISPVTTTPAVTVTQVVTAQPVTPTTTRPVNGPTCTARVTTSEKWPNGFFAVIDVTAGNQQVNSWQLGLEAASVVALGEMTSSQGVANESSISLVNTTYNGSIPPNGTVSVAVMGNGDLPIGPVSCIAS